jgi:hypothetical protein
MNNKLLQVTASRYGKSNNVNEFTWIFVSRKWYAIWLISRKQERESGYSLDKRNQRRGTVSGICTEKNKGITLIDLEVAMAIIDTGTTLVASNIGAWIPIYRLRSATRDVVSALREAKMRAISGNTQHQVSFDPAASSYILGNLRHSDSIPREANDHRENNTGGFGNAENNKDAGGPFTKPLRTHNRQTRPLAFGGRKGSSVGVCGRKRVDIQYRD